MSFPGQTLHRRGPLWGTRHKLRDWLGRSAPQKEVGAFPGEHTAKGKGVHLPGNTNFTLG